MAAFVGVLIILAAVYQMCFRYEHWPSKENEGIYYEHDNLTGETRPVKPGAKVSVFARILGSGPDDGSIPGDRLLESIDLGRGGNRRIEPLDSPPLPEDGLNPADRIIISHDSKAIASIAKPVPAPHEVVVATTAPPVPMTMMAVDIEDAKDHARPFAVRQVDLNQDGEKEEIIQNALRSDGYLDISIVKNGREIFYGRGKQISLLPTRSNRGWTDIALKGSGDEMKVFRYNPRADVYRSLNETQ